MSLNKRPYKGTRDFFPEKKREQNYLFENMSKAALSFGYEPYDGPLLEEVELYRAKSGDELINEQIYSFLDRGNREVAIRPEMTPTVARMVAQVHREISRPIRWYSIANLMRYERPQKGRLREHWQLNCDIFGAPGIEGEVEILQLVITFLNRLGATQEHFEVRLNDRQIVDWIFKNLLKVTEAQVFKLYKIVDRSAKVDFQKIQQMISELELSSSQEKIFYDYLKLESFEDLNDFMKQASDDKVTDNLNQIIQQMAQLKLTPYLKFDPGIVRGLDYYTGMVFEIFDKSARTPRALCGGGAYGNLLKIFGEPPLGGVGLGLGDVTLTDFLKESDLLPSFDRPLNDIFIGFSVPEGKIPAYRLAQAIRQKGLRVICGLSPSKIAKIPANAAKKGARFVALLGEQELSSNQVQIKNMETHKAVNLAMDDFNKIAEFIK
jgi:histidyl-tRNA synthetase